MAKPDKPEKEHGHGKPEERGYGTGPGNKGQDKIYVVTNPLTGETRTVTQRQWREEKLGKAGFEKPADLPEAPDEEVPPVA